MIGLNRIALAWGTAAIALVPAAAGAQRAGNAVSASGQANDGGTSSADQAAANDASNTGEIIVTATRRNERLQDVPGSVSALTGGTLEQLRAKTLADFAAYTPGVSFEATSPSTNRVVIRGITTGGTQLNSAIGLYLDDVPIGSSTPFGFGVLAINLGLFDLQRIEVLNGPQGTLFGANALGGTLRYITEAPVPGKLSGRVEGEGGYTEHGAGDWAGRATVNVPFGDKTALRVDGIAEKDAGFVDDPDHGRKNLGDARLLNGRAQLLFEATPDLSVKLSGFGQRTKSDGIAYAFRDPTTHRPTEGTYDQSFASRQPSKAQLYVGSGTVDWDLHFAKLASITAYQDTRIDNRRDFAVAYSAILGSVLGPAAIQPYVIPASVKTKRFTQEVRLASGSNKSFEWVAGAFYSHEKTCQDISAVNTADPAGKLFGFTLAQFLLPSTAREFALFGNATVYINPKLDATVGIRQSWNHQVFTSNGVGLLINPAAPGIPVVSTGKSNENVQTYLFNLRYRPVDGLLIYGRIASGYRPGGPNLIIGGASTGNDSFKSDKLWNYEVGVKQSLGGRGFFDLSGYHIDWSDIQQVRNIGGINQLVNAGNARINGVESLLSLRLVSDLNLLVSGSYTDAKLTTTAPVLGLTYSGFRLPLTAKFSAAVAGNYDFTVNGNLSGTFNLAFRRIGRRNAGYPGSAVAPLYRLGSYNVVDATLSLRTASGWEIGPYIKNLFDVHGEVSASTINNQYVPTTPVEVTLSQPRTFGVVVGKSF